MSQTAAEWLKVSGNVQRYVECDPFTTAAGLQANRKINLDLPDESSPFYRTWTYRFRVLHLSTAPYPYGLMSNQGDQNENRRV
jgi:hypothetical protein